MKPGSYAADKSVLGVRINEIPPTLTAQQPRLPNSIIKGEVKTPH